MANKAAPKMTKKEQEEAKKRRMMVILLAVLMVGIMLFGVLLQFISPSSLRNVGTNDTQKTSTFNSIVDALKYLPKSADYIRFVDLNSSLPVAEWAGLNVGYNLPNESLFGRLPYKDVVVSFPYPTMGLAYVEPNNKQVIILSDFGRGYDNASYPKVSVTGGEVRIVQGTYGFSPDTYPTIIGRKEYVGIMENFIKTSTVPDTAYATYASLIEQTNGTAATAKFAVVGTSDSLGFGDRFYAGVTPINGTQCDYKIVIRLNQTLNETRMNDIATRWQDGAALYDIQASAPQFKTDYVILSARGDIDKCLNDMAISWEFIHG